MTWDGASKTFAATTRVPTTSPAQQVTDVYPQEHQPLPQRHESAEEIHKRLGWVPVTTADDDLRDRIDEVCDVR